MNKKIILILTVIFIALGSYASWYSFNRNQIIIHNKGCDMSRIMCDLVPRTIWEVITDSPSSVLPGYIPARFGPMHDAGCNQSATTTPCNALPEEHQPEVSKTEEAPILLTQTFEDKKYGFKMQYPNTLAVEKGQNGVLVIKEKTVSDGGKGFQFYIMNSETAPQWSHSLTSIKDFEKEIIVAKSSGRTYKSVPTENTLFQLPNGVSVLRQISDIRVYDDYGKDVTNECEECSSQTRTYILFKNPQNYYLLTSGKFGNLTTEEKMVHSIEYGE